MTKPYTIVERGLEEEVVDLLASGESEATISRKLDVPQSSVNRFIAARRDIRTKALTKSEKMQEKLLEKDIAMLEQYKEAIDNLLMTENADMPDALAAAIAKNDRDMIRFYRSHKLSITREMQKVIDMYHRFQNGILVKAEISGNLNIIADIINDSPSYSEDI